MKLTTTFFICLFTSVVSSCCNCQDYEIPELVPLPDCPDAIVPGIYVIEGTGEVLVEPCVK